MFRYFRKKKIVLAIQAIYGNDFYYDNTVLQITAEENGVKDLINLNYISGVTATNAVQMSGNYCVNVNSSAGTLSNADQIFNFGTSDFTVEFEIYPTVGTFHVIDCRPLTTNGAYLTISCSNQILDVTFAGTSHTAGQAISLNTKSHVAYVRKSGTGKLYINGILAMTTADATNYISNNAARFGYNSMAANSYGFYMDNFRVTKGRGRYATDFLPSSISFESKSFANTAYDPVFKNVSCLHKFNNSLTDALGTSFVQSLTGTVSFEASQKRFGSHSLYVTNNGFIRTTDKLKSFDLEKEDFTIEAWISPTSYGSRAVNTIVSTNAWTLYINQTGYLVWVVHGGSTLTSTVRKVPVSGFSHVSVVRNGATTYIYLNGEQVGSGTASNPIYAISHFTIGSTTAIGGGALDSTTNQFLDGYIDEVRVTKGFARYPAPFKLMLNEFPVSVKPDNLSGDIFYKNVVGIYSLNNDYVNSVNSTAGTAQNVTFSATDKMFGTHSAVFNGTNSNIKIPSLAIGTGDFTVEGFALATSLTTAKMLFANSNGWANSTGMSFWLGTADSGDTTRIAFGRYGLTSYSATGVLTTNSWFHWAVSRHCGVIRVYVNGVKVIQSNETNNLSTPSTLTNAVIGNQNLTTQAWVGNIDEVRITVGQGRYTGNSIQIPTTVFTNTYLSDYALDYPSDPFKNNVVLAFDYQRVQAYDKTGKRINVNGGKLTTATSVDCASQYMNGNGDYFGFDWSNDFDFGTGDFTIEAWINPTSNTKTNAIVAFNTDCHLGYWLHSSGKMHYFSSSNGTSWDLTAGDTGPLNGIGSIILEPGIMHHVAWCRIGNMFYGFVDGKLDYSQDVGTTTIISRQEALNIGRWGSGTAAVSFGGHLSKLRITKGVGRYSSDFTPKVMY